MQENITLNNNTSTESEDPEETRKKITVPGLSGLRNIGNTCYMNSALQCLCATNLLLAFLLKKDFHSDLYSNSQDIVANRVRKQENITDSDNVSVYVSDIKKEYKASVTYNLYKLIRAMWQLNQEITPKTFKETIGRLNPVFKGYTQNDSQEFLSFVLDRIHEELKREISVKYNNIPDSVKKYDIVRKNFTSSLENEQLDITKKEEILSQFKTYKREHMPEVAIYKYLTYWKKYVENNHSIINDIFMGMYYTEIICKECNEKSLVFEPYNILSLPIPDDGEIDLETCIKNFTVEEELKDKNQYKCEECKKYVDATRKTSIWETPDVLIIQLKRFKNVGNFTTKVRCTVKYPINNLSFENYYSEYFPRNHKYDLYAVIQHTGSLHGGHYISHTKNAINNKWYEFNDNDVLHIPDDDLEKELVSRDSYILFYRKKEYFNYDEK